MRRLLTKRSLGTQDRFIRKLTDEEVERYDVIPATLAGKVWLVRVPILPGGYAGMTISRLVMLARPTPPDTPSSLLAHELVHVGQFTDLGIVRFTWRYNLAFVQGLWTLRSWQAAYRAIPAEKEARKETGDWARRTSGAKRTSRANEGHQKS
jgi:hypothetical protein